MIQCNIILTEILKFIQKKFREKFILYAKLYQISVSKSRKLY